MTTDEQLIDKLRAAMLAEVAAVEVPAGLLAAVERPQVRRFPVPSLGGVVAALAGACAVTIAVVALTSLSHSVPTKPRHPAARLSAGMRAIEATYAVLRRPQTATDRLPAWAVRDVRSLVTRRIPFVPALTRLVATEDVGAGRLSHVRVYLIIYRVGSGALRPETIEITDSRHIVQGLHGPTRGGVQSNIGIARSVVPDGVRYVRWSFAEVTGTGQVRTVLVSAAVRDNVAVARLPIGSRGLVRSVWVESAGSMLTYRAAAAIEQARAQVRAQRALVAASARHRIAPALLAHFGLLRTQLGYAAPAMTVPGWATLVTPRNVRGLNLERARYLAIAMLPPLARRSGVWVVPGSRGLCLETWNVGGCNGLGPSLRGSLSISGTSARSTGIVGLVPDGNLSVTVVLTNGTRRTAQVRDNVYSIVVPGRAVAVIVRDAAGRLVRIAL